MLNLKGGGGMTDDLSGIGYSSSDDEGSGCNYDGAGEIQFLHIEPGAFAVKMIHRD